MSSQQKHCTPAALEMFYSQQQQQPPGATSRGLYAALSHLGQVKEGEPELPQPWLPVASISSEKKPPESSNQDLQLGEE